MRYSSERSDMVQNLPYDEIQLNEAIRIFRMEYRKALELDSVKKPISCALHQTWKRFDKKEKERNE